jgi:ATP-dependent Clp protease ATP-binding subunit ClpE
MKCQNCGIHPANISLHYQMNDEVNKLYICQECYNQVSKGNSGSPYNLGGLAGFSNIDQLIQGMLSGTHGKNAKIKTHTQNQSQPSILDELGRNLTISARSGAIDAVIGRDEEIEQVIEILNRRNKNNPVLIGQPGVGKTAIAEGLALKIVEGNVPVKLLDKEVYTLDVASLVAGTGIRGQFEEKMKAIIETLQSRKNIILFIDEIHLLVGAGKAEGSMDAGNILKPALARGELQLIGATTLREYRQIEKDAALERRFQPVTVDEPTEDEAIQILMGLREKYETFHGVKYSDEAIRACVTLSQRYIQDRFLPDKAIDLLDQAGAKINLKSGNKGESDLQLQLQKTREAKQRATQEENYEEAARLRDQEGKIEQSLQNQNKAVSPDVTNEDIQLIVEKKTGIPVSKLQAEETMKMKNLKDRLESKVIGQDEAVEKISKAIKRSRAGLGSKTRPIASFLFIGPTGVGKTELAKSLAEELFGSKESMIRLDMSEYMEKHAVSKLIGSPPGYVGHEEAGQLTERVRRNPYSIILLDEVEKAHPDVMNIFLQIMDDGRLTDSQGRTVSFKDAVIIMTSNAGVTEPKKITVGFGSTEESGPLEMMDKLKNYFRPEFLNRFDSIIEFRPLAKQDLLKIVEILLQDVTEKVKELGFELTVSEKAKEKLAEIGYNPVFGARPLRRTIQDKIEDSIADLMMEEMNVRGFDVVLEEDKIIVKSI